MAGVDNVVLLLYATRLEVVDEERTVDDDRRSLLL